MLNTSPCDDSSQGTQLSFRIACWPWWGNWNPYQTLFYDALAPIGVKLQGAIQIDDRWLLEHAGQIDAIHFHWPEGIWRTRGRYFLAQLRGLIGLQRYLRLAERLGIKRIWTVHNFENHESTHQIDRWGYRILAQHSDLLICHDAQTAERIHDRDRPRAPVVVMPHGNYAGIYPSPNPKQEVLKALGLPEDRLTFCCVGQIRSYKGFELAAEAVKQIGNRVQLIIAGKPHDYDVAKLKQSSSTQGNIHVIDRSLNNQEFSDVIGASHAVLLPYRRITGSGAVLAAITLGRGVIVSDLDYFRELCRPEPDAAAFFRSGDVKALAAAMQSYTEISSEVRSEAVARLSDCYRWEKCISPVAAVLRQWMIPN